MADKMKRMKEILYSYKDIDLLNKLTDKKN